MTVGECITAYRAVAEKAFTPKRGLHLPRSPNGAYSATALEAAIKQVIQEHCKEPDCVARRTQDVSTGTCPHSKKLFRDEACVKTLVLRLETILHN